MRFGVVGTAYWAEHVHLPALVAHPGVELVGVYGRNNERAAELAENVSIQNYGSYEELLSDVDAVSFAVPPAVQATLARAAGESGKHILLEKPMTGGYKSAEGLLRTIRQYGVGAVCFLTRLYTDECSSFVEESRQEEWQHGWAAFASGALLLGSPYANSVWRKHGTAALWDLAPHSLSVLFSVLGIAEAVSARYEGDAINLLLTHSDSRTSEVIVSLRKWQGQVFEEYMFENESIQRDLQLERADPRIAFTTAIDFLLRPGSEADRARDEALAFCLQIIATLEAADRSLNAHAAVQPILTLG